MNATEQNNNQCTVLPIPRLNEYVDATRVIIRELKDAGATPNEIIGFLKGTPEPSKTPEKIEIEIDLDIAPEEFRTEVKSGKSPTHPYTARQIARELGLYSIYGKPHAHAVSAILNNNLFIDDEHKDERILFATEDFIVYYTLYDEYAAACTADWVEYHGFPYEIDGYYYTYHVQYV